VAGGLRIGLFAILIIPLLLIKNGYSSWEFKDDMSNWRANGWFITKDSEKGEVVQSALTVTIRDIEPEGRFFIGRKAKWEIPFTFQVRLQLLQSENQSGSALVLANITEEKCATLYIFKNMFIGGKMLNVTEFHTYTLFVKSDERLEIYLDDDFTKPAHSSMLPKNQDERGKGVGLIIGFPAVSTGEIVVDKVAYGRGKMLEIAKGWDVSEKGKLPIVWGGMKKELAKAI